MVLFDFDNYYVLVLQNSVNMIKVMLLLISFVASICHDFGPNSASITSVNFQFSAL